MKAIAETRRSLSFLFKVNVDRLLVPLLIVAALYLAGAIFGYATTH